MIIHKSKQNGSKNTDVHWHNAGLVRALLSDLLQGKYPLMSSDGFVLCELRAVMKNKDELKLCYSSVNKLVMLLFCLITLLAWLLYNDQCLMKL